MSDKPDLEQMTKAELMMTVKQCGPDAQAAWRILKRRHDEFAARRTTEGYMATFHPSDNEAEITSVEAEKMAFAVEGKFPKLAKEIELYD